MPRILITGATGTLGRALMPLLESGPALVRILSRRERPRDIADRMEWVRTNIASPQPVAAALEGVDTVLHLASDSKKPKEADIRGTDLLLKAARRARTSHFVYISITGIDNSPFRYFRAKLEAERLVEDSGIPWTILRATQFHSFVDGMISSAHRLPLMVLPKGLFQSVDVGEAASRLARAAMGRPAGRLPDCVGPEVLPFERMARMWLDARGIKRRVFSLTFPGGTARAFRRGRNTNTAGLAGGITWQEWLAERYGDSPELARSAGA